MFAVRASVASYEKNMLIFYQIPGCVCPLQHSICFGIEDMSYIIICLLMVRKFILTLQPFGKRACKQDVSQFALSVSFHSIITRFTVDVIKSKASPSVGHRCHDYNAGRSRIFDEVKQQVG